MQAIAGLANITKIPELKRRLLFTFLILAVYRIGAHIPTPGINGDALQALFAASSNSLLGLFDIFTGGAAARMAVFSLGIMPYISASIILQLMTVVVPYLERLSKEGEAGRKKITQYTRYGTIFLGVVQSLGIAIGLEGQPGPAGEQIVLHAG